MITGHIDDRRGCESVPNSNGEILGIMADRLQKDLTFLRQESLLAEGTIPFPFGPLSPGMSLESSAGPIAHDTILSGALGLIEFIEEVRFHRDDLAEGAIVPDAPRGQNKQREQSRDEPFLPALTDRPAQPGEAEPDEPQD